MKTLWFKAAVSLCGAFLSAAPAAADRCRTIQVLSAEANVPVIGMEDIAVDGGRGVAYLSAYDRRSESGAANAADPTLSGIFRLSLADLDRAHDDGAPVTVEALSADWTGGATFRPHGISLFIDDSGRRTLFVVNHRDRAGGGAKSVEIFDIVDDRMVHRQPGGTVLGSALCSPNDVAAVDRDRFLVTLDHGSCTWWERLSEDVFSLPRAGVAYYDGTELRPVADRMLFANGIVLGRSGDESAGRVFVSATREKAIRVYDAEGLLQATSPIHEPLMRIPLDGGPDNLSWGPDGRLIVAVHPALFRLGLFLKGLFGVSSAPSRIVALTPGVSGGDRQVLFADDGSRLPAATVGVVERGRLLIGAVAGDRLGLCDGLGRRG
ncbi:MAG: hypothetical protein CMM50_00050 [Rhodospirillaceae bacterium]|nr:hypothetical protein [Rhodospirillaceae bacterium]|tara:strand:- start:288 stop:1424 length:1137 start_codon:yes stop_codon:yes gene_type:complete